VGDWAHVAAAGIIEAVLASRPAQDVVPGIATLAHPDPDCAGIRVSTTTQSHAGIPR
jgi:hypothetical protein